MKLESWSATTAALVVLTALGMTPQAIAEPLSELNKNSAHPAIALLHSNEQIAEQNDNALEFNKPSSFPETAGSGMAGVGAIASQPNETANQSSLETPVSTGQPLALEEVLATDALLLGGTITSITQFADVSPGDWAFEALRFLVEEYSCLDGYPDQTFRGNRSMTRYEFAAGLAACLDSVAGGVDNSDTLATIQRLQEEFALELASLQERVTDLENRTALLEAQQFSTTTVLRGNAWFNVTQAFPTDPILTERNPNAPDSPFVPPIRDANNRPSRVERDDPQLTMSYLTWLNLVTSFTGRDTLVTQLAVGNGSSPANELVSSGFFNTWGTPFLDQTGGPEADDVVIRELFYSFPVGDRVQVTVGPRINYYRYFDGNAFTFFITGATSFNSNGSTLLSPVDRGSGAVVQWQIVDPLEFTLGYLAESSEFLPSPPFNSASDVNRGLFNGTNTISAQLAFAPTDTLNLRFIYARSTLEPYTGYIGDATGEPIPYGVVDDGFGGTVNASGADAFVFNFDWLIADWIGIFGRYSYGNVDVNPVNQARDGGDIRVQSFQAGLGFPDLGKQGALGVISFLVPHDYLEGRRFLLAGGGDGGTQYELEASYRYPLTDNIAVVPAFYTIWNANNFDSNPTVFVGNVRMEFAF